MRRAHNDTLSADQAKPQGPLGYKVDAPVHYTSLDLRFAYHALLWLCNDDVVVDRSVKITTDQEDLHKPDQPNQLIESTWKIVEVSKFYHHRSTCIFVELFIERLSNNLNFDRFVYFF